MYGSHFGKYPVSGLDDPLIGKVQDIMGTDTVYPARVGFSLSIGDLPALVVAVFLMLVYKKEVIGKG